MLLIFTWIADKILLIKSSRQNQIKILDYKKKLFLTIDRMNSVAKYCLTVPSFLSLSFLFFLLSELSLHADTHVT